MTAPHLAARASRPGVAFLFAGLLSLALALLLGACGGRGPDVPTQRRTWEGPGPGVFSEGVTVYDRREIAQKVPLPTCLQAGDDRYRFAQVVSIPDNSLTPPGLVDTMFRLDRWRLWRQPGAPAGQPIVYLTIRGSTAILAEYRLLAAGERCNP